MNNKKLTVFIKNKPESLGALQKINVDCEYCAYCISEDYPLCFHGNGCAVVEQIKKTIDIKDIIHNTSNKDNPSVSIITKNISELSNAYDAVIKAKEFCTGKEK